VQGSAAKARAEKKKASEKLLARYLEAQDECIHTRCLRRCFRSDALTKRVHLLQETLESFHGRKLGELAQKTLSGVEAHGASYTKEIETQKATLLERGIKGRGEDSLPCTLADRPLAADLNAYPSDCYCRHTEQAKKHARSAVGGHRLACCRV
jgi:hypothetical protein